jgi:LuxR family maltose regulon positive regulatory protein
MLVSAPAGFGKTTLLAEWLTGGEHRVAWVSLDQGDNHPTTFWTYLVAALQTVAPEVGVSAHALLQAARPAPISTVLTTLINDLGATDGDVLLVLDDFHVIDNCDIQDGMAFLLDHLPPQLHVVLTCRADPALPLARLRARGELVEVRAADLRFTPEEAVAYLNGVMGLELTPADVRALESRTEGWIAALQLAALSMQGRDNATVFIAGFAGDSRYIVDYLVEEVLAQQPDQIQRFLLQTSVLDRLSAALCDAVMGQDDGKALLAALDRGNLFLVPLDDRRRWYRYHHLFAEVLRARLLDEQPELLPVLHRRASDWYERNGELAVAVEHALAAEHFDRAAELVELAAPATHRNRQESTLLRWLQALPDAYVRARPMLCNGYAGALMATGEFEGVESRLRDAERWIDAVPGDLQGGEDAAEMVVTDVEGFRVFPSSVAVHRAGLALALGDTAGTIAHARRAQDLAGEDNLLGRAAASALLGLAHWGNGHLEAAQAGYAESMTWMLRAGHRVDVLGLAIATADIQIVRGRLGEAMRTYEQALRLAHPDGGPVLRGTADMYVGMAALHRERGDLSTATQLLLRSQELGEHLGLPQNPYRWRVAMARVREAEGDLDGAVQLLDQAEQVYVGDFAPNVRPIPALRARMHLAQGRLDDALAWAREHGLSVENDLNYLREYEHVTLARLLLAQYRLEGGESHRQQGLELLDRLLRAAEDGGRKTCAVEILVLQAAADQERGDTAAALVPLERALVLAESEDYVRIFVDAGASIATLLTKAAERGTTPGYVRRLLIAFGLPSSRVTSTPGLIQPLSERELDVLRLLATELGGPEIARQLVLSLNTVRTHTKNIYAKLGVNSRRAAVRAATELDLLRRSAP